MNLTARERQCLALLAEGKRDKEIARVLVVDPSTARKHVENARRKLGARTRAQAVALMLKEEI